MKIVVGFVIFAFAVLVSGDEPFTFFLHDSCIRSRGQAFTKFLLGTYKMVNSALMMLRNREEDPYRELLFRILFKTERTNEEGNAIAERLEEILNEFLNMRASEDRNPVSGPQSANFRWYCDNDRIDGTGRWRLREDPPEAFLPRPYFPNVLRPRLPQVPGGIYREYWDPVNVIMMGPSAGCSSRTGDGPHNTLASTWDTLSPQASHPEYPRILIRATTTFCDLGLGDPGFVTLETLRPGAPLWELGNIINRLQYSAGVILHEFCHYPPFRLVDLRSPRYNPEAGRFKAYEWEDVLDIVSPADSIRNVNNVVFFAILARLRHLGWRLLGGEPAVRLGILVWRPEGA